MQGATPVGGVFGGIVIPLLGIPLTVALSALVVATRAIWGLGIRELRSSDSAPSPTTVSQPVVPVMWREPVDWRGFRPTAPSRPRRLRMSLLVNRRFPRARRQDVNAIGFERAAGVARVYASRGWIAITLAVLLLNSGCAPDSVQTGSSPAEPSATAAGVELVPATITEYPADNPSDLALGPDGAIWFTGHGPNYIGRINQSGQATFFPTPAVGEKRSGITSGPDGNLWFSEFAGSKIGRLTPQGVFTFFPLAHSTAVTNVVAGPDGAIWFAEGPANMIGRITIDGQITEYPIPTPNADPRYVARGADDALWFAEYGADRIGRITMQGEVTEYSLPTTGSGPTGITTGRDGTLWFTEQTGDRIGRLTPGTGVIAEYALPPGSGPYAIASGADGSLWFTEFAVEANRIGQLIPTADRIRLRQFAIPTARSNPAGVIVLPDGHVWFVENSGGHIATFAPPQ